MIPLYMLCISCVERQLCVYNIYNLDTNNLYIPYIQTNYSLSICIFEKYIYYMIFIYSNTWISHPVTTHLASGYYIVHPLLIPCIYFRFNLLPDSPPTHTTGGGRNHDTVRPHTKRRRGVYIYIYYTVPFSINVYFIIIIINNY